MAMTKDEIQSKMVDITCEQLQVPREQVNPSTSFVDDLGADSLDLLDLVFRLEEAFGIQIERGQIEARIREAMGGEPYEIDGVLTPGEWAPVSAPDTPPGPVAELKWGADGKEVPFASRAWIRTDGDGICIGVSSTLDPKKEATRGHQWDRDDAVEVFLGRMDFARELGARVINTNAAASRLRKRFSRNIEVLARHAEAIGLRIGLENPGDGSDNLLNTASDGPGLLADINHPMVGLNYDAGNTISHRPGVVPADDALMAMPLCLHTHIKDVRADATGYFFTPLGQGQIDCARILRAVAQTDMNLSIEIPMRLHRLPNAQPSRAPYRVPLADIEAVLRPALAFVNEHLDVPALAQP